MNCCTLTGRRGAVSALADRVSRGCACAPGTVNSMASSSSSFLLPHPSSLPSFLLPPPSSSSLVHLLALLALLVVILLQILPPPPLPLFSVPEMMQQSLQQCSPVADRAGVAVLHALHLTGVPHFLPSPDADQRLLRLQKHPPTHNPRCDSATELEGGVYTVRPAVHGIQTAKLAQFDAIESRYCNGSQHHAPWRRRRRTMRTSARSRSG